LDDVPASLESASAFRTAGEWLLHEGRWEDASRRFAAVAQSISRVDKSESEAISIHFVAAAAALFNAGNLESYERLRQLAAERFSSTTSPVIADEVVKSCLIKPADPEILAKLDPLIKIIETNIPWDRKDGPKDLMEAWQMLSMSLAAYRKGDYQLAEDWARRCLSHPNRNLSRSAAVRAILAMAAHRLGRVDEAHAELDTTRAAILAYFDKPFLIGNSPDGFWFDWLIARILLKEADGLIAR
jgi:tetratricopeptide (TPR) repeat protein